MRKMLFVLTALSVVTFLVAGCERGRSGSGVTSDSEVKDEVVESLKSDEGLNAADIDVDIADGVVTLKGEVDTQAEADRAVQIASKVPNVKSVNSQLQVEPVLTNEDVEERVEENEKSVEEKIEETQEDRSVGDAAGDAAITSKVKMAFAKDDQVSALKIDVDTKNGQVTLTGNVKSEAEAKRAIQIAESVEGVQRVTSVLTIKP